MAPPFHVSLQVVPGHFGCTYHTKVDLVESGGLTRTQQLKICQEVKTLLERDWRLDAVRVIDTPGEPVGLEIGVMQLQMTTVFAEVLNTLRANLASLQEAKPEVTFEIGVEGRVSPYEGQQRWQYGGHSARRLLDRVVIESMTAAETQFVQAPLTGTRTS